MGYLEDLAKKAKKAKRAIGTAQVKKTININPRTSSWVLKRARSQYHWRKDRKAHSEMTTRDQQKINHFKKGVMVSIEATLAEGGGFPDELSHDPPSI